MNRQRAVGFFLVALQAAALAYCFRTWFFSAAVVGVGLIGWLSRLRLATPRAALRWPLVLAILYGIERRVAPPEWYSGTRSFFWPDLCLIAEYFVVFQVGQFFVRREGDRLPSYLPILAIVAITFTGDLQVRGPARVVFQLFSLGLVFLCAAYFAVCRLPGEGTLSRGPARHRVLLGLTLLVTGALAWLAAGSLYAHARQLDTLLGTMLNPPMQPESAGFSGQGRLGSVAKHKGTSGNQVALRIWTAQSPGYLRGRAFDVYDGSEWRRSGERIPLAAEAEERVLPRLGSDSRHGMTFLLPRAAAGSEAWQRTEIWPNQPFSEILFLPPDLAAVQAPVDRLALDRHGILEAEELPASTPYVAWTSAASAPTRPAAAQVGRALLPVAAQEAGALLPAANNPTGKSARPTSVAHDAEQSQVEPLSPDDWRLLTSLPDDIDPRVRALAHRVAGQDPTAGEKIAAVERYFLDNYQYQFGIDIPPQTDPLAYFLLEKPPAHCEYFATGAAILLRAVGVPSRYVTGFVAAERNDYGGYWVARNRDAHAWAEAFDPQRGWVLVEATPASGVPQATSASSASQFWDAWRARWQRFVAAFQQGGLRAILGMVVEMLKRPWCWVALLVLAGGLAIRRLIRGARSDSVAECDPWVAAMRRLLQQMDGRLRKVDLVRLPHETLHQFAARLIAVSTNAEYHQAAEWYRRFAALRYGGRADAAELQSLQEDCARIAIPALTSNELGFQFTTPSL